MGMSTHVSGFRPPDEKWRQMKTVWDACRAAKIPPPKEVIAFFDDGPPDENGVEVRLENKECCKPWHSESAAGFEIDLKKLPPHVTIIRFYNSF